MLNTQQSTEPSEILVGLVFCHGWGMSPNYWQPLLEVLPNLPHLVWDCGYYSPDSTVPEKPLPSPDNSDTTWVAVGHSFGVIQLLQSGFPFGGIVGLQSFLNFLGDETTQPRQEKGLRRMQQQFAQSPHALMTGFYKTAELPSELQPNAAEANITRLGDDLAKLEQDFSDLRDGYSVPSLWLSSTNDTIVPPGVVDATVLALTSPATVAVYPTGGHALHCHHPQWVAEHLMAFLPSVAKPSASLRGRVPVAP
ncbi:MAG: alpha/beta hydrolase [Vampirovibrionales bacterium]|nr:alpha/beta hydrolase [Vampirovibrionales bacterium]